MKFKPNGDRYLIKPIPPPTKTAGGLDLVTTVEEKSTKGTIINVGPGKPLDAGGYRVLPFTIGDTVLYSKYCGTEIKLDGETYVLLGRDDVLGMLYE